MEIETVYLVINFLSSFAPMLPLWIGLANKSRLEASQDYLLVLVFIAFVVQVVANILWLYSNNNLFLMHFYVPVEFGLIMLLYSKWLQKWIMKAHFYFGILFFLAFSIINSLFVQSIYEFNSNAITLAYILYIGMAIFYFYKILNEEKLTPLEKNPKFWINTSILIYFSASLLVSSLSNQINTKSQLFVNISWAFHAFLNTLHYVLYAIGLWVRPKI